MLGWSDLPYDLLVLIANELHDVVDFLSFSFVCRHWNSLYLNKEWDCSRTMPWLMLYGHVLPKGNFLSLSNVKYYDLPVQEAINCRCWGTSCGWIAAFDETFILRLFNPVTQVCISLPSLKDVVGILYKITNDWFSAVGKTIVFKLQGKMVVMIIGEHSRTLAFCRHGDGYWATVKFPTTVSLSDVVCCGNQVLAVTMNGTLMRVDMNMNVPDGPKAYFAVPPPEGEIGWFCLYLAESKGKLLLVIGHNTRQLRFNVYELDVSKGKWAAVYDLGGNTLVVDEYRCTSVSPQGLFMPNCIYFVSDNSLWLATDLYQLTWLTVYDMKAKTSEALWISKHCLVYSWPLWMTPSIW